MVNIKYIRTCVTRYSTVPIARCVDKAVLSILNDQIRKLWTFITPGMLKSVLWTSRKSIP